MIPELKVFDYEGETEYIMENKIIEYDKRIDNIIRHMIKTDDYEKEVIAARNISESKRREVINEYTELFFNTYPYESENPLLEAQEMLAHLERYHQRKKTR